MVIDELKAQLQYTINKYGINSIQAYNMSLMLSIELDSNYKPNTLQSYYNDSFIALTEYIKKSESNPNEAKWNKYAVNNDYLSSQTIGYIYGDGFNKLCKEIRKQLREI